MKQVATILEKHVMKSVFFAIAFGCLVSCSDSARDPFVEGSHSDLGDASPPVETASCVDAIADTKRAVDIIVTVDQSGSMGEEVAQVTSNINLLSSLLAVSGLDYRVLMVAEFGRGNNLVCVPPPLGGDDCGSNGSVFRAVNFPVGSTNALSILLSTIDSPDAAQEWADFLRPNVLKVFAPITDDDSAMSATVFDGALIRREDGLFGVEAARNYVFFPIIGANDFPATEMCATAATAGRQYQLLAQLTNGKWFSLCRPSLDSMLEAVGQATIARAVCEVAVPEPPQGVTIDLEKINVRLVPTSGDPVVIPQDSSLPCADGADGWQFSGDNKKIVLCGASCTAAQNDLSKKLTVGFGCDTVTR